MKGHGCHLSADGHHGYRKETEEEEEIEVRGVSVMVRTRDETRTNAKKDVMYLSV